MHAVPGGGPATLTADGVTIGSAVDFAGVTEFTDVPEGEIRLELKGADGKTLARARESLSGERQTIVATKPDGGVRLRPYRDGRARAGQARLRAIHAAPELGAVQVSIDGRDLDGPVQPGDSTPYETVEPGTYDIEAMRTRGGGPPLASRSGAALTAGAAGTALIVGSGGARTMIVVAEDATAAPKEGPATGLGGSQRDTPWRLVLAAALAAGLLGAGVYGRAARRDAA